jgi:5-methylcytosine-specific restriction endonuclease McrA
MTDILHKPTVLVLNRSWQPIHTKTVAEAICMLATDVATALDIDGQNMQAVKWTDWMKLPVRETDCAVHTSKMAIRVPTVIVLCNYAKVPKKRPKLSSKTIWERDNGICQYTGRKLSPEEANIDHVLPRSKGGATSWENCVLADKKVNSRKADRLPQEAGLKLSRAPQAPKELPVSLFIRNKHGVQDWNHFLS